MHDGDSRGERHCFDLVVRYIDCRFAKPLMELLYLRAHIEGGVFFFTVTLADRSSDVLVRHVDRLRRIYASVQKRHPFETIAICVLPDHLHVIWSLPEGDADFPLRWNLIKAGFSRGLAGNRPRSASKIDRRERGIWQRRYRSHYTLVLRPHH